MTGRDDRGGFAPRSGKPTGAETASIEFSRPIDTSRLPRDESVHEIAATPGERAELATRFGLLALDRLEARIRLRRLPGGMFRLAADLSAEVTQVCVVTLEPVASRINEHFTLLFGAVQDTAEIVLDSEAETVEPLEDGVIDLGETVAQQLSLALDPYPRAPGAGAASPGAANEDGVRSAFAALAQWSKSSQTKE